MRAITESFLRESFRSEVPESFVLGKGQILTPSAAQYLKEKRVALVKTGKEDTGSGGKNAGAPGKKSRGENRPAPSTVDPEAALPGYESRTSYQSARDGGAFAKKPEHMTQLHGRLLVPKNHPRILFRGKLDSLQSFTLVLQHGAAMAKNTGLVEDLGQILVWEREVLKAEVLDQPFTESTLLGLTDAELRERSHNPKKFFKTGHILPALGMDLMLLRLNKLRSEVREVELAAVSAFTEEFKVDRMDLIQALNRMSSAVYIMMLKFSAGIYK